MPYGTKEGPLSANLANLLMYNCTNIPNFFKKFVDQAGSTRLASTEVSQRIEAKLDPVALSYCADGKKPGRWLRTSHLGGFIKVRYLEIDTKYRLIEGSG